MASPTLLACSATPHKTEARDTPEVPKGKKKPAEAGFFLSGVPNQRNLDWGTTFISPSKEAI
jgi:hypothetical protein